MEKPPVMDVSKSKSNLGEPIEALGFAERLHFAVHLVFDSGVQIRRISVLKDDASELIGVIGENKGLNVADNEGVAILGEEFSLSPHVCG
jgi:hypothetical protein